MVVDDDDGSEVLKCFADGVDASAEKWTDVRQ